MNDRADLAVVTEADGVHVGQNELSVKEARRIVGPHRLVGVSTHTIEQARQAVLDGADYIGVGPVFSSATKSFTSLAGLELVRQVAAEIALPWFAIGGINAENVGSVLDAGATRIAVSHAILSADDPEAAAKALHGRVMRGES
jgi:thiamine-phosphate pyrophosphorylase